MYDGEVGPMASQRPAAGSHAVTPLIGRAASESHLQRNFFPRERKRNHRRSPVRKTGGIAAMQRCGRAILKKLFGDSNYKPEL